ncbi:MAG: hypothetical protein DI586_08675 [Micavibrio aeruginosavorus]|uniref:MobA/MobL protein domain-containing protein n=1 Tax=Micavibrio aeruginosavorus TaxID=349221 RepID=A0A2W5FKC3_9BACT|nr:MAG: hypothetical protein DI586_08675 [Micavibrio aeruginosavorus]
MTWVRGNSLAIYHCSLRSFSRGLGHSAVAAAAYRSGENLKDERTGRFHNYQNRKGVADTFILTPGNVSDTYQDRITLWSAAESSETRKNSRVAREVILALPYELTDNQRLCLTRDMAAYLVEKYQVAVDAAIHTPVEKDGHDPRNHHAHLLFTTRELSSEGFGKKTRILDDREQGPVQVELIRDVWEALANEALKAAGFETRIDKRSLEDQGIDRIPQTHIGNTATHADEEEDSEEGDSKDEDEGETDTDGKSGSGDTGTIEPNLKAKEAEITPKKDPDNKREAKAREVDNKVIDKGRSRADFVHEIKKLNEQRAAFSDVPLKIQIEKIDRLMDRLDGRLEKLKTLSDKTSLPERLKVVILSLFGKAKDAIVFREEYRQERKLTADERIVRAERQQARYGKAYRVGIHEQIREMRENIQTLKTKETEYKKYDAFVSLIERRIEQVKAEKGFLPPLPIKPEWTQKVVTKQAVNSKIGLEAKQIKEKMPIESRFSDKQERLAPVFKSTGAKTQAETVVKPEKSFTKAVSPIKAGTEAGRDQSKALIKETSSDKINFKETPEVKSAVNTKDWKITANEKMRPFMDKIQKEIQEAKAKATNENANKKSTLSEAFNNPKPEVKRTTTEDVLNKVRKEAQQARQNVPPEFRAAPYEPPPNTSKPEPTASSAFSQAWQAANPTPESEIIPEPEIHKTGSQEAEPKKPRSRMSAAFNNAASTEAQNPSSSIDPTPELK